MGIQMEILKVSYLQNFKIRDMHCGSAYQRVSAIYKRSVLKVALA
jgi:hypothetical protein